MRIIEFLNTVAATCSEITAVDESSEVLKRQEASVKDRILKLSKIQVESISPIEVELKDEVAIAIDFGDCPMKSDVEAFLEANEIGATFLICSNAKGRVKIDLNNDLSLTLKELRGYFKAIEEKSSFTKVHLFINGPMELAFIIDYFSRNIDSYIYKLNCGENVAPSQKYVTVMKVSDELKRNGDSEKLVV